MPDPKIDEISTLSTPSSVPMSVPDLPEDLFLLVLKDLAAWDLVSCQRVSKSWRATCTKPEYIRLVLQHHPRTKEVRELSPGALLFRPLPGCDIDWQSILLTVASRYLSLTKGTARKVSRYPMAALEQLGDWFPVGQWDYHESQPGGRLYYETATMHLNRMGSKPFLFRPTLWSYDDGLLVYAPSQCSKDGHIRFPQILALLDIATGERCPVPFDIRSKIIRNIRLKERTMIIEWAERDPFHNLNAMEQVNRHFASCFDVHRGKDQTSWTVDWRSEWKMHFLGLPPNYHDRFFSTHTSAHYAVYFWQPNRSMYTGDEEMPIESLSVWDISTPSSYQPSADPSGRSRPPEKEGPHIVSKFSFTDMEFVGIRQHASIALMSLHLDSESLSLTVRENIAVAGQGYFDPAERLWCAKTTTFPFLGQGPRLYREWDGGLPPYRGHCTMESADIEDGEKWFLPVMDVVDAEAGVRLSLVETCISGMNVQNQFVIRMKTETGGIVRGQKEEDCELEWVTLAGGLTKEVAAMGRIAGDERWLIGQNERMEIVVLKF
ncbi:hypothetical protein A1O3_04554 [Capronia epimyces CBS 606.96]|uniref:F-box domain-containing protein n=1 Tax=Capronia epimyces CBS 606.96 TaxID=1182542 RepID=W9Y4Z5_9EURO|nr:uncharacterized protein A1O3_04554 [Capronia epimyces CBS 606.96]EXJ87593.1 hypothetical protein A1O3_04554 [Capronia epimyces CBS 606.96]